MNINVTPTQARLLAEAKARRQRLFNPPNARREAPAPEAEPPMPKAPQPRNYDAHIVAWMQRKSLSPMKAFVVSRAEADGVDFATVAGPRRTDAIVLIRQRYMYEVKRAFPAATLNQIGKLFGGRDHTTVLHGIRAHSERTDLPMLDTSSGHCREADVDAWRPSKRAERQSGIKGINWDADRQKWLVRLYAHNRRYHGGSFDHLDDAIARLEKLKGEVHARTAR